MKRFFAGLLGPHAGPSGALSSGFDTIEEARRDGTGKMGANLKAEKVGIFELVEVGGRQASPINYTPAKEPVSIKTGIDELDHQHRSHDQEPFRARNGNLAEQF